MVGRQTHDAITISGPVQAPGLRRVGPHEVPLNDLGLALSLQQGQRT